MLISIQACFVVVLNVGALSCNSQEPFHVSSGETSERTAEVRKEPSTNTSLSDSVVVLVGQGPTVDNWFDGPFHHATGSEVEVIRTERGDSLELTIRDRTGGAGVVAVLLLEPSSSGLMATCRASWHWDSHKRNSPSRGDFDHAHWTVWTNSSYVRNANPLYVKFSATGVMDKIPLLISGGIVTSFRD